MSDSVPPVKKPELLERVFEQKLLFFAVCVAVFLDLVHLRAFGTHLAEFSKDDFDGITYGWALIAAIAYLAMMCFMHHLYHWAGLLLFTPVDFLYKKKIPLPIDPGFVHIEALKEYATSKGLKIDWDIAAAYEQELKTKEDMRILRFATGVLLLVDVWTPGSFLRSGVIAPLTALEEVAPFHIGVLAVQVVVSLSVLHLIGRALASPHLLERYLFLPRHALAVAKTERIAKERAAHLLPPPSYADRESCTLRRPAPGTDASG